ncbi:MAG: DNA repair exonuclease [Candidatus Microthrix sp.]|nr:DNA repair exonuclease [Candidatus Microthrix sp.]
MKILHAADLHIDSPLGGLTAYEGAPAEEIRGATRRATENLIQAAIDHEVSLVVLAGDIFDGDWPDYGTGLFWNEQLNRLHGDGIPVVSVAGNHDAQSLISRNLPLPPNLTQLSTSKPETVTFAELGIEVIGQGYATRDVSLDLTQAYPDGDPNLFTIGLLHTSLNGRPGHASYAPSSVDALRAKGYQYWALRTRPRPRDRPQGPVDRVPRQHPGPPRSRGRLQRGHAHHSRGRCGVQGGAPDTRRRPVGPLHYRCHRLYLRRRCTFGRGGAPFGHCFRRGRPPGRGTGRDHRVLRCTRRPLGRSA